MQFLDICFYSFSVLAVPPCSIYSEGSGSKISSCASLDLSAEDFILEPGYAECADAIKSGAIKKVSVSYERLVDLSKHDPSSEIYANPQILFRKRSKMLEDNLADGHGNTDDPVGRKVEKLKDKKKKNKPKPEPVEAPPLPARNYSLYLENEEAESVVKEVLDDIAQANDGEVLNEDDAFEVKEECKEKSVNKDESEGNDTKEVKDEHAECASVKEKDSGDKVTRESEKVADDLNEEGCLESVTNNLNEQTEDVKEKLLDTCEECKGCEQTDKQDIEDHVVAECKGECFHVTVTDKSGNEKVLKIVEKEESFKIKDKRRESNRKFKEVEPSNCDSKADESANEPEEQSKEKDDESDVNEAKELTSDVTNTEISQNCQGSQGCIKDVVKDSKELKEPTEVISELTPCKSNSISIETKDSNTAINTDAIVNDMCEKEKCETKDFVKPSVPHINTEIEVLENIDALQHCAECPKTGCAETPTVSGFEQLLSNTNPYHANYNKTQDGCHSNLLTVNVVKMKSVSTDSDNSDFPEFLDLPKLEINESDLENPFDSSDNSNGSVNGLDIATESATIEKLTNDLTHDIMAIEDVDKTIQCNVTDEGVVGNETESDTKDVDQTNETKVTDSVDQQNKEGNENEDPTSIEQAMAGDSEQTQIGAEIISYSKDSKEITAISESVVDETNNFAIDISNEKRSLSEVVRPENLELSDDSAIENNDEDDKDDDSSLTMKETNNCENVDSNTSKSTTNTEDVGLSVRDDSLADNLVSLAAAVELQYPGIYDDTEPTHMTIREVMNRSPNFEPVFRTESPTDRDAGFNLVHADSVSSSNQNIPVSGFSASNPDSPPPRPPPVNSGQSQTLNSNSSQSSVSTVDTPPEESPPLFRFAYGSGQSDEESPPALPPKGRERQPNRRPGICTNSSMIN